ncbi:MAG: orc1/cdc6 family replication initiation protein [Candidatus Pacearchaeota archaeon]|nr:orc1/cdc6 family replication initiation protein [Candidatus Pacearchaeota archaeon]
MTKEKELIVDGQNRGKEYSAGESRDSGEQAKNNIDSIFNAFIKHTIFKNKFVLQSNYAPENIPHREKQINQIAPIVAPSLRLERPSNLFIYGLTGTGKTLVVQYIRNQLFKKAKDQQVCVVMPFINCKLRKVADTEYRILAELIKKLGGKVAATGLPTDQLYKRFVDIVDEKKQIIIVVFDEIDQAVKRIGDEFLYNFTRLNTELTQAQISMIGISNDLKFLDSLDPRVRSSLGEEEILFAPYNALQLQDILRHRSNEAFKSGILDNGVIEKCAAYAAREHGDARRALDLLRISGELVERDGKKKITLDYIDKAKEKMEADKILIAVENQPKQFQLVLISVLQLYRQALKENESMIFTGDIYNLYRDFCVRTQTECLTQRRVSDIIAEFDMLGLINAKVISKGRHGRTREIRVDLSENLREKINMILMNSLNLT